MKKEKKKKRISQKEEMAPSKYPDVKGFVASETQGKAPFVSRSVVSGHGRCLRNEKSVRSARAQNDDAWRLETWSRQWGSQQLFQNKTAMWLTLLFRKKRIRIRMKRPWRETG